MKYSEVIKAVQKIMAGYTQQLTVRQIYYRLISPPFQLFENVQKRYNSYDRMLTKAREKRHIDWTRIADRTREFLGGDYGFDSIEEYLAVKLAEFKRNEFSMPLWTGQPCLPICWIEKDALSTQCASVADRFNVVTFPSRGYSSFTKVMEVIQQFGGNGKSVIILHLSDHDPSGLDMTQDIKNRLSKYGLSNFEVRRIALNYEQVRQYNLASNPVKMKDTRHKEYVSKYGMGVWELDSIDPNVLMQIIEDAIKSCIDIDAWNERIAEIQKNKKKVEETINRLILVLNNAMEEDGDDNNA